MIYTVTRFQMVCNWCHAVKIGQSKEDLLGPGDWVVIPSPPSEKGVDGHLCPACFEKVYIAMSRPTDGGTGLLREILKDPKWPT